MLSLLDAATKADSRQASLQEFEAWVLLLSLAKLLSLILHVQLLYKGIVARLELQHAMKCDADREQHTRQSTNIS